jgi:steroid delta-isomerase-like uncharacterized protein
MAANPVSVDSRARRMALVSEHVRCENAHDLNGVIQTFGDAARYDDEPWDALPDLSIEIVRQHVSDEAIILEVIIRGTQCGAWRGLPATGRRVEIPLCGVYTFSTDDRLAGEKIYYDRALVLRQLGVFREPQSALGRLGILLAHPLTILRTLVSRPAKPQGGVSH